MNKEFRQIRDAEIIKYYKKGLTFKELTKKFKLKNHNTVSYILKREGVYGRECEKSEPIFTEGEQRIHDKLKEPLPKYDIMKTQYISKYDIGYGYAPKGVW
jgi:hypothetical protein